MNISIARRIFNDKMPSLVNRYKISQRDGVSPLGEKATTYRFADDSKAVCTEAMPWNPLDADTPPEFNRIPIWEFFTPKGKLIGRI